MMSPCFFPDKVLPATNGGPIVQSYRVPGLKILESYAAGKLAAAAPGLHTEGLDCNTCANDAANVTCSSQVTTCDEDTSCSTCISCLFADASATVASCGCDLSNQPTAGLATCLLQACPQCGSSSGGMGGSATSTLSADGSPCSSNEECESCVCDMDNGTCITP